MSVFNFLLHFNPRKMKIEDPRQHVIEILISNRLNTTGFDAHVIQIFILNQSGSDDPCQYCNSLNCCYCPLQFYDFSIDNFDKLLDGWYFLIGLGSPNITIPAISSVKQDKDPWGAFLGGGKMWIEIIIKMIFLWVNRFTSHSAFSQDLLCFKCFWVSYCNDTVH